MDRRSYLAAAGVALLAGCVGESEPTASSGGAGTDPPTVPTTSRGLPLPADTETLVGELLQGASKDGIPSIDSPEFFDASAADDWLDSGHPVFGVIRNGEARAYPQRILVWHEIVNDTIGGEQVAITYCPLTGTAQGFERGETEFGVSGQLLNSNLVMYDRATDSYWPQMLAVGITERHEGDELIEFDVTWTTWERWRSTYPDTLMLTDDTGYARDYSRDPYGSYDPPRGHYADEHLLFPQFGSGSDHEFHPKRVVLGMRTADGALAVLKDVLAESGVVEADVGGVPYVAVYDPELHTGWFYRNPDQQTITPEASGVTVDGTAYQPNELPLESVVRYDAMWFAWEGYYPETEVVG